MILINSTTLYILRNQVVARAVPPARFIYKYLNINSSNLAQETCRGSFFKWFRHSQVPFGLSSWPTLPRKDATTCCQHWPNRKNTPNAHRHQIQSTKNKSCRQQSPPAPAKPPSSQNLCESPPIFLHPPLCNNLPQTDDEFTNSHLKLHSNDGTKQAAPRHLVEQHKSYLKGLLDHHSGLSDMNLLKNVHHLPSSRKLASTCSWRSYS